MHARLIALSIWPAAVLIAIAPALVAADSGGVLPWTQWAAAGVVLACLVLALPIAGSAERLVGLRGNSIGLLLMVAALMGAMQCVRLPPSLLSLVAPGSTDAFRTALAPLSLVASDAGTIANAVDPISISTWFTRGSSALLAVSAAFAILGAQLFTTRVRLAWLLIALGLTGAIQASFGLVQFIIDGNRTVWGIQSYFGGAPFGSFINRNNAAVMLNLGVAASLGLIAWRLAALTGAVLNEDDFPASELLDVVFDRSAMLGIVSATLCVAGLLACGSRGGLIGAIAGLLLALGLIQSIHRGRGVLGSLLGLGLMAAILLINFELPFKSVDRLSETSDAWMADSVIEDGRLEHWRDGWTTAMAQPAVGWGLGTYRYAYLPFQRFSGGTWFVNADNLWLEWFVETGVIGMGLVAIAGIAIILALRRLAPSPDPIDHGLSIAGWYALGSMAVSQFFDFGLRIPANSFAAALLLGALVARAASIGDMTEPPSRRRRRTHELESAIQPKRPENVGRSYWVRTPICNVLVLATAILAVGIAIKHLHGRAMSDHAVRLARFIPRAEQLDPAATERLIERLEGHLSEHRDDHAAWIAVSRLRVDLARYRAIAVAIVDPTDPQWVSAYRLTSPRSLRSVWHKRLIEIDRLEDPPPLFPDSQNSESLLDLVGDEEAQIRSRDERLRFGEALSHARSNAVAALVASPQSDQATLELVKLDFAGGDPRQTEALLANAARLRSRNSNTLRSIGDLAAQSQAWTLAAESWRRAITLSPSISHAILTSVDKNSPLTADQIVPDEPAAMAVAATLELTRERPSVGLLTRALEVFRQSMPEDRGEKVTRLRLIARILTKRDQPAQAAQALADAIALTPGDTETRYQYVVALKAAGNIPEARRQARTGRQLAPQDPRFDQLIAQMAEIVGESN